MLYKNIGYIHIREVNKIQKKMLYVYQVKEYEAQEDIVQEDMVFGFDVQEDKVQEYRLQALWRTNAPGIY